MKIEDIITELESMSIFYSQEDTARVIKLTHEFIMGYGEYFPNHIANLDSLQIEMRLLNNIISSGFDGSETFKAEKCNSARNAILIFIRSIVPKIPSDF